MERDKDASAQSRRPQVRRYESDSQVSQVSSSDHNHNHNHNNNNRQKQKHVVGGGHGGGRLHTRVNSAKALHKQQQTSTTTTLNTDHRTSMLAHPHRRATSDLRLTAAAAAHHNSSSSSAHPHATHQPSSHSHSNFQPNLATKRNKSHVEISKRAKSHSNIKRSSSHKDVRKAKGAKSTVHFDLGDNDGNDDEWVDASGSASPYLSRRGSVMSGGQSPGKPAQSNNNNNNNNSNDNNTNGDNRPHTPTPPSPSHSPDETAQHNNYITSRLLKRTPSHGAPPQMSTESATVPPPSGSPVSQHSHGPPSLYGTPKNPSSLGGASGPEELTSRFMNGSGPSSGGPSDASYFISAHAPTSRTEAIRRPHSTANLQQNHQDSSSDEEDGSALAPRSRRSLRQPASQSRTQQKLNLQRASSTIEPTQPGPGVGVSRPSLLVGSNDYEHRDPRIGKLLERTGMEYLVVRRYQNPIARSIARIAHLPGVNKHQTIPKQNGANGNSKSSMDLGGAGRLGLSQSLSDVATARSRPATPRRSTSIRTTGARSSYDGDEDRERMNTRGSENSNYVGRNGNEDEITALLRNLWDKNSLDLSASQD
ncbi:hypothetical protein F5Y16DRAFT_366102 [Xylariaceae sp. FL0255]|nr:hypothetical protein F5Y16DRAFT_366102 [Xylariaceae sp. FL0255]